MIHVGFASGLAFLTLLSTCCLNSQLRCLRTSITLYTHAKHEPINPEMILRVYIQQFQVMFDIQQSIVSQKCPPYIIDYSFFSVIIIVQTFITYCCRFYPLCDYRLVSRSFFSMYIQQVFLKRNSETFVPSKF